MASADSLIAVVDDESLVRTMVGRLLHLADYEVITFASGEDFLDSLNARRPACAILDVYMPGLSGFDVQSRIRDARMRIPVVLITASDDMTLERSAIAAGAVCLLRKPFSSEALLGAIGRALHSRNVAT